MAVNLAWRAILMYARNRRILPIPPTLATLTQADYQTRLAGEVVDHAPSKTFLFKDFLVSMLDRVHENETEDKVSGFLPLILW